MRKIPLARILTASVETSAPDAPVKEVLQRMAALRISCIVAVDAQQRPLGIFTERDAVRLLAGQSGRSGLKMADVMSSPVFHLPGSMDFREAYRDLQMRGFRHLSVVDDQGRMLGIVTETDFLHHLDAGDLSEFKSAGKVMSRHIVTVDAGAPLAQAIELMGQHRYSCVVVTREQSLHGILTERDAVRLSLEAEDMESVTVGEVIRRPLITIPPDTPLPDAIRLMESHKIRHLVVAAEGKLHGLLTRHDLLKSMHGNYVHFLQETIEVQRRELFELVQQRTLFTLHDAALSAANNAILITDRNGITQWANPAFSALTGYTLEEIVGKPIRDLTRSGEHDKAFYKSLWDTILAGSVWHGELLNRRKDGSLYPEEMTVTPVRMQDEITHFIAVKQDITERKFAEAQLHEAAAVMRHTHEGMVITDTRPRIIAINDAYTAITGYSAEEVIGRDPGILNSGRADPTFFERMWGALREHGHWQGEIWNRRKSGELYPQLLTISAVRDAQNRPVRYIGVFADITQLKESQAQLEFMAHHDPLTRLPNRSLVETRLAQEVELARRHDHQIAVLFIDLDRFKLVNDSFGHLVGDELLCAVSDRLGRRLREGDTLGRLGGDEFILLVAPLRDPQDAAIVARDFITTLNEPFRLSDGSETFIGASIGISLFPRDGDNLHELMKNADAAMYLAKESGRNQFSFYTRALNADARDRLVMENDLRHAVQQSELTLQYQPKVDLTDGHIIGAEVLARWRLPDGRQIPPGQFIPLAEKSSLIIDLGNWGIDQTCRQLRLWMDAGLNPPCVAINISARQFHSGMLDKQLQQALERHGIAAQHLELELTESMLMQEPELATATMLRLKQIGVKLALDDFGTGYSSLTYLSRFPIDTLKIDQSFVRGVTTESNDAEIASAIIGLAHRMKLRVVAEGVETADQLAFMRANECDELQGYYFSRPVEPEQFAAMLQAGKRLAD